MVSIDLIDDEIELKTILFNELLSQMLDCSVVLYLFFKEFGHLALAVIFKELVSWQETTSNSWALHIREVISLSVG